jgi:membrane-associated phospholipid phosphatase
VTSTADSRSVPGWPMVVSITCLTTVGLLGWAVHGQVPEVDRWLHALALRHRGGPVPAIARVLTQGGSTHLVWPMVAAAALIFPRSSDPRRWLTTAAVAVGAWVAVAVRLQTSIRLHRTRPPVEDWAFTAGGYAFPSGHTTAATLGAGLLAWALTRHLRSRRVQALVWLLAAGYAVTIGWTRVWLGVHWPLDVLGGWLMGVGLLTGLAVIIAVVPGLDDPDSHRPVSD